jgi:clan AA aspartic protease (TIGR02281 family)
MPRRFRLQSVVASIGQPLSVPTIALVLSLVVALPSSSEIFRWTDENGRLHFSQDLNQVPPAHRRAAEAAAAAPRNANTRRVQTYSSPAAPAPGSRRSSPVDPGASGQVHRIRVQRAGSSMTATVLINGRLNVPFHLDTGASDVVLPEWAAKELGLDLAGARTGIYGTANGTITQKLVMLDSVELGTAAVENVPASVSSTMKTGLLGVSFFNHFKYDFDPSTGIVTLKHNDLAESGRLKGGRSQGQWRGQFRSMNRRIDRAEARIDEVPFGRTRERERLEGVLEDLKRELGLLEDEADTAQVPFAWRD